MSTPFEAPFIDRDAARQIVVDYLVGTSSRYGYFKLLESFLEDTRETKSSGKNEEARTPQKPDFKTEVERGRHSVNNVLRELGGLPVRFTSQDTGETVGSLIDCTSFDLETDIWEFNVHLRSVQTMPKRAGNKPFAAVEFKPGELQQSYYDAIAPSPSKAA